MRAFWLLFAPILCVSAEASKKAKRGGLSESDWTDGTIRVRAARTEAESEQLRLDFHGGGSARLSGECENWFEKS